VQTQAAFIGAEETLRQAGHRMRELGVVTLRVRGRDGTLRGTVSQDMIVRTIAAGGDPKYLTVAELAPEGPGTAGRPRQPAAA